jgi:hypothetical protein
MEREEVIQMVKVARSRGERPDLSKFDLSQTNLSLLDLRDVILGGQLDNLIGADLRGADLSKADLSDAWFKENPLAGMYRLDGHTKPVPSPDLVMAKYNDKTKFPEGFDRYEEMEKVD